MSVSGGYGAPEYSDADFEIMRELRRILVDGGKVISTFPFNERELSVSLRDGTQLNDYKGYLMGGSFWM